MKQNEKKKKTRILVVEDEAIIAKDIKRRLEKHGYEVPSIVSTGSGAVRKVEKDEPDLVLMDIVMPGEIDGIDAARLIRSRYDVPIIYLTAYADEAILERAIPTEPFGYVTKPFEDSELCRAIEMGLFKHSMEKQLRESEEWLSTILGSIGDGVIATDRRGGIQFMNPVAESLTGWDHESASGRVVTEVFRVVEGGAVPDPSCPVSKVLREDFSDILHGDCAIVSRDGEERMVTGSGAPLVGGGGEILGAVIVFRDVTAERKTQRELVRSREDLRVQAEEIKERNIALKVLLEQREKDRLEFEERILANIRHLALPYMEKLKKVRLAPEDRASIHILESNLEQITSAFSHRLSSSLVGLTPREISIANLVKEGRQDKEVSEILNISFETVKTHKQNIRKKLGIYGQRKNLQSFLSRFSG
jgi:PAS domain S-box-containing protein